MLTDIPIPEDAPVKLPWQAPAVLETLLRPARISQAKSLKRRTPPVKAAPQETPPEKPRALTIEDEPVLFSSDVRMVNLTATVYDAVQLICKRELMFQTAMDPYPLVQLIGEPGLCHKSHLPAASSQEVPVLISGSMFIETPTNPQIS